ncbi:hypothetical protein HH213_14935 [Duganella dendranthematis]|uniref:Replication origin-binding protein domain-containing protein n=1 Tax=Duganella dendranthematis TaxID=2728021 RepID=A0ABX6MAA7_9BURK|nr:plasmid replication protein, CyRepA1 family [Duganella dendranthematis]QJD91253.1 hypothetical protein HH213_14935 [Duganella dendranthematis]
MVIAPSGNGAEPLGTGKLLALVQNLKKAHEPPPELKEEKYAGAIYLNDRYLGVPIAHMSNELSQAKVLFVKSPKGTGKTQWLVQYLNSLPAAWRILQLGHRRSLERMLARALGLQCYLDERSPTDRYAVSMDSSDFIQSHHSYDVLVLDEVEQVLRHFLAETTELKRNLIFKILVRLLREAKQVICLDADMTGELTVDLIAKLMGQFDTSATRTIINEWKTDRTIELYEDRDHLIAEMIAAIEAGERVYVPVGKLGLATKLKSLLQFVLDKDGNPVKVLSLNGDTNDERNHKAFFDDPNNESKKYQVLIATSTLSTGVSIDVKWFDAVYGLFDAKVYTFQDCDQAISRVRSPKYVKVWIHDDKRDGLPSEDAIRKGPAARELETRNLSLNMTDAELNEGELLYLDFVTRLTWCEQQWRHNRQKQFIGLKQGEGWTVELVPVDEGVKQAGAEMLKIAANPDGKKKYRVILEAPTLSVEQVNELREVPQTKLTRTEKHSLKKALIADFLGLKSASDLTLQQVIDYDSKKLRNVLRDVKLLEQSRSDALQYDRIERESKWTNRAFPDYRHNTRRRDLLLGAMHAVAVDPVKVLRKAAQYKRVEDEYTAAMVGISGKSRQGRAVSKQRNEQLDELQWQITEAQIDRGALYATNNLQALNSFLGTRFKSPDAPEAKVKVFNVMMKHLGVAIKQKRVMENGVTSSIYCIDYEQVAELAGAVDFSLYPDLLEG